MPAVSAIALAGLASEKVPTELPLTSVTVIGPPGSVIDPFASRLSPNAVLVRSTGPSMVMPVVEAAGPVTVGPVTSVKPPMRSVVGRLVPPLMIDSRVGSISSCPAALVPATLVWIAENGASSTVPNGTVIVLLALPTVIASATSEMRPNWLAFSAAVAVASPSCRLPPASVTSKNRLFPI